MTDPQDSYVVVDFWRAIAANTDSDTHLLERELTLLATHFRRMPGVLSCDFARVAGGTEGGGGRYMAVFRYASAAAREAFVTDPTAAVSDSLARLAAWWELDSPVYRGEPFSEATP